jgi:hypothetical protein
MAQEFTINSSAIESKINQLLPSQGGFGAGVDFSASTMVIPIVDLTESASGSSLREDLQTAYDYSTTYFDITNASRTTIIATTGFYQLFGNISSFAVSGTVKVDIEIYDGAAYKFLLKTNSATTVTSVGFIPSIPFNFKVFLRAGDSIVGSANSTAARLQGAFRQIADINGNLTNPNNFSLL